MSMHWLFMRLPAEQLATLAPALALPEDADESSEEEWWDTAAFNRLESTRPLLDIDLAWHTIHFLLTGEPWGGIGPLARAILGTAPGGALDVTALSQGSPTYADPAAEEILPAGMVDPIEVGAIAAALRNTPDAALDARYDPAQFQALGLYPWLGAEGDGETWYVQRRDTVYTGDALRAYIMECYHDLVAFYQEAATAGEALLQYPMGMM